MIVKKVIIIVLILSIVSGVVFWLFSSQFNKGSKGNAQVTLNVWGLWEDDSAIKPALDAYKQQHPNVTINYVHQSSINYRPRVQTQIQAGQGPDIFMIHNTWVPMFLLTNQLSSVPQAVMTPSEFSSTFYPVAKDTLVKNNKIYALPLEIDGLALYYNEDILKAAGVGVPSDWFKFTDTATKVTVKDTAGNIKTAGAALGTTGNVDHWPDIIGLLFSQQPGADLNKPNNAFGAQVLSFYTSFVVDPKHKTWDPSMESSTQAFEEGKLAFYFAPSWRAQEIRLANPNLNFKIAPVPQLPGNPQVNWATFWAFGVSSGSQNQAAAWDFLKYLTSAESERSVYKNAASTRLFGEPYSRVDLGTELAQDPLVGAFVNQGPYYKSWYLSSKTFDIGINDEMIKYFEDAVNAVQGGKSGPEAALDTAAKGVTQVLQKYTTPTAPGTSP
jgi:multiple sugar transport system substrate-binding protein